MKRKILVAVLALALCTIGLLGCKDSHTHSYSSVLTHPTCFEQGYTTFTCECGDSYISDYVDATGHAYARGVCTVCQAEQPITTGLEYRWYNSNDGGYYDCVGIGTATDKDILIPNTYNDLPVKNIYSDAFKDCTELKSVTIQNGITSIYGEAFAGCTNLTSVYIPDSVERIDKWAFQSCRSLVNVNFPDGITEIDIGVFLYCDSLIEFVIPDSVETIESDAFRGCDKLSTIIIPDGVNYIGDEAFHGCGLTNVVLPYTVTIIEDGVFYFCEKFTKVYYTGTIIDEANIKIGKYNNKQLTNATWYYYSESEPAVSGRYWRYVDGVPTEW